MVSGPLLESLAQVKEWKPPVQRGKRVWDDHKFFESLESQFKQKRSLSDKQVASLKKMVKRYADQVPDYESLSEKFELGPLKKSSPKEPKEKEEETAAS